MNIETAKINLTTVVSIVLASFALFFFLSDLIDEAVIQSKIYTISLDIERDESVVEMYAFKMQNNIAAPNDQARKETLERKIDIRRAEKALLEAQL